MTGDNIPFCLVSRVLPTGSAPGGITADARKVYQQAPTWDPGKRLAWLDSALISRYRTAPNESERLVKLIVRAIAGWL